MRSIPGKRAAPSTGRRRCQTGLPGCSSRKRFGRALPQSYSPLSDSSALRYPPTGSKMLECWRRGIARQAFKLSAANLAHYLALRRRDLRDLQDELTLLGLSSLGRLEARVLANLDAVIAALAPHAGDQAPFPSARAFYRGERLLERNSAELFGRRERRRRAIMVTFGTEAAEDPDLVIDLARRGMDVARINGAHDTPDLWMRMVANVRRAGRACGRDLRILFDLAGPSCRTGEVVAPRTGASNRAIACCLSEGL